MPDITVITGSTLGNTEYVAEHLAEKLQDAGFSVESIHGAKLSQLPIQGIWLVITSTHGAGELPDNIQPLFKQIKEDAVDLSQIKFGAIGLGSSEYDTFCEGIRTMETLLTQQGAIRIGERLEIDITLHEIPEDPAEVWLADWIIELKDQLKKY